MPREFRSGVIVPAQGDRIYRLGTSSDISNATSGAAPSWDPSKNTTSVWFPMNKTSGTGNSLLLLDQSGNGYNASVTSASAPTIVPNVLNGNPVLRMVAANSQYMTFGGINIIVPPNTSSTGVIVAKSAGVVSSGNFSTPLSAAVSVSVPSYQCWVLSNTAGYNPLFWGGGDGGASLGVGPATFDYSSAFYGLVTDFNGTGTFSNAANFTATSNNAPLTLNATGLVSTNIASSLVGAYPSAGPGLFYDGDIAEIIVFVPGLDAPTHALLHTYLTTKYGAGVG